MVELKCVQAHTDEHLAQTLNYLKRLDIMLRFSSIFNIPRWSGGGLFTIFDSFAFIRVHLRPVLFCLTVPALLVASAEAAPPVLRALEPRGAQRGQALKVTLVGDSLLPGAEIGTTLRGFFPGCRPLLRKARANCLFCFS